MRDATRGSGLVIDTGGANVRVATHGAVRCIPNAIARTRPGTQRQVLVGADIEAKCNDYGGLQLRLPIDRGLVVDWPAQKAVWDQAIAAELGISRADTFNALSGRTVIATEPYFVLPEQQRAFEALLFDWYGAQALWRAVPAQLVPYALPVRPECLLVVDLGHSYTHAVPIVRDDVQWHAVKRLDVCGKVVTNLLKEMFSFRQWNMMDETFLTDKMKSRSCFVAAAPQDGAAKASTTETLPRNWTFSQLVELFHDDPYNNVVQEYVLPDYAEPEQARDPATKYGYIRTGPGARGTRLPSDPDAALDVFIAGDASTPRRAKSTDQQVLTLGQERYQLLEHYFAPQRIGLQQGSLAELVATSIGLVEEPFRDLMWSHIVLVGETASAAGMRRRLAAEIRAIAPIDLPVDVRVPDDPGNAAVAGAAALLRASGADAKLLASRTF
ncbi:Actin- protein 6 [Malassezia cuniculi]|uniref:Actin- protein 6 n=1 Tax=Malassezia cuniculi TaxID=948313 RepID=A0AAF0EU88_9BASI|nr:Actin- protein 6 [Malassezia cuniculi]